MSEHTAQGIVFSAVHEPTQLKLILKLSPQRVPHRTAASGWSAADDAMVEGKILAYMAEVAAALRNPFVPHYYGQFLVASRQGTSTLMIQEHVPIAIDEALQVCSAQPQMLLSFFVELLRAVSAMHAVGVIHNDLHGNNIRARQRTRGTRLRSLRDGKTYESTCPFDVVIIDFGRACIRDGVCARDSVSMFPAARAHHDFVRLLTSMSRPTIAQVAAKMLLRTKTCTNWKDICVLLTIMHCFGLAVSCAWDEATGRWSRPFRPDGTADQYVYALGECLRMGVSMPFASSHYLFASLLGPPLVELLSKPKKTVGKDVQRIHIAPKGVYA